MGKTLRKMMCAVLSAALCFSNLNITAISADTVLDSQMTSEDIQISGESEENGTDLILDDGSDAVVSDGLDETGTDPAFENQGENAASGEEENTIYEPVNRIHETEQVGVKLTDWWYKNPEGEKQKIETSSASEENQTTVVCDLSQIEEDGFSEAGFDLSFAFLKEGEERTVQASDYLSFTLPACFKELAVTGAQEDYYTYVLEEQEDHSYKMTVTFQTIPETPDLCGTIHMAFSLQETMENEAGSTCLIVLQGNKTDPMASVSCEVIFPVKNVDDMDTESAQENTTVPGINEDTTQESEEEAVSSPFIGADITDDMAQLKINLGYAWYSDANGERIPLIEETGRTNFSVIPEQELDGKQTVSAGISVLYRLLKNGEERTVHAGDMFSVVFPPFIKNVCLYGTGQECYEGNENAIAGIQSEWNEEEHKFTVIFQEEIEGTEVTDVHGKIAVAFDFDLTRLESKVSETRMTLQRGENPNEFVFVMPAVMAQEPDDVAAEKITEEVSEATSDETQEETTDEEAEMMLFSVENGVMLSNVGEGTNSETQVFKVSGEIVFNEILGTMDWRTLVRPLEFEQPIKITLTYNEGTEEKTVVKYAQDDLSTDEYYLRFIHDGEGGGEFTIDNIPKKVKVGDVEYDVTKCEVNVEPNLPYYQSGSPITENNISEAVTTVGTLHLNLKSQKLTLHPTIIPTDGTSNAAFIMNATFKNPVEEIEVKAAGKQINKSYYPSKDTPSEIDVPVGITYHVVQSATTGYKFTNNYTIEEKTGDTTASKETNDAADGTMSEGTDVTITTANYAQNISVYFGVNWIDNNSSTRPSLASIADQGIFVLQYKTTNGEWTDFTTTLTEKQKSELGISEIPSLNISLGNDGRYSYNNLPRVDANYADIQYRVRLSDNTKAPKGYVSTGIDNTDPDKSDNENTFDFTEKADFKATIQWNDQDRPADVQRPNLQCLNLYRHIGNGEYEFVQNVTEESITKAEDSWAVNVAGLPRYNSSNQEYDYVLVQGTISGTTVTQTPIADNYKSYYYNGTGSYGTDAQLCHNNGKITEVLYEEVDFTVHKEWLDPGDTTAADRPSATLTLWRYVKTDPVKSIDQAYKKGVAAQVIYQTTVDGNAVDNIVSCPLSKERNETINFNEMKFPKYDDNGREYIYFVRETLSGEGADNYDIKYQVLNTAVSDDPENGTYTGGTIKNVRREKAAVVINKVWKNPSNLGNIAGTTVQMEVLAPHVEGQADKPLTVYSSLPNSYAELTGNDKISAQSTYKFVSGVSSAEVVYYVNIYDENGQPYSMENLQIKETIRKEGTEIDSGKAGESVTINSNQYNVTTQYVSTNTQDGMQRYHYTQTNTVTGKRDYTLKKVWASSINTIEYSEITAINFTLKRKSTDPTNNSGFETVDGNWQITDTTNWDDVLSDLEKYDSNGYVYEYRAEELSLESSGGITITNEGKGWTSYHTYTSDQTTVTNYKGGEGNNSYFYVNKNWIDNGDVELRKNVKIRIYDRSQLKTALESMGNVAEDSVVDLDDLKVNNTELAKYEALVSRDGSNTLISYNTLKNAIHQGDPEDYNWDDYIVLEYLVGDDSDGATKAQYTYKALKDVASGNSAYSISGKISNTKRSYNINIAVNTDGNVQITNTRTGIVNITVEKEWKDGGNSTGNRPDSVQFTLKQDGVSYKKTVQINGQNASAVFDSASGVITLSEKTGETNNTWSFTLTGLPMFSENGVPHTYDVEENENQTNTASPGAQQDTVSYIKQKGATNVSGGDKVINYTYSFSNTIVGTTSHFAYKYWKDTHIPGSSGIRPDLYMKLYRYTKTSESEESTDPTGAVIFNDYSDQIWQTKEEVGDNDTFSETDYQWKITVNDLPRFDDNGNEYGYVFVETMNNEGTTVLGTYIPEVVRRTDANGKTYEFFTNTIQDYMKVEGFKTWRGLDGFQTTADDLPEPVITLYRTSDDTVKGYTDQQIDAQFSALTSGADPKLVLVDTTTLTNNKTEYSFPDANVTNDEINKGLIIMVSDKDGNSIPMLPKYEGGKSYKYFVRESISGEISSQLYTETNTNGTLTNTFRSDMNRRTIKVKKTWERSILKNNEDKYPSVTFYLYRYEAGNEGSTKKLIETKTINAEQFQNSENGIAYCEFSNLLIYSPKGVQYCYYITEKAINGYNISYVDEPGIKDGSIKNHEIIIAGGAKQQITETWLNQLTSNERMDVVSLPANWANSTNSEVQVESHNSYTNKGSMSITGTKSWNDYMVWDKTLNNGAGGFVSLRPESITVTLSRHTENETNQQNKVPSTPVTLHQSGDIPENCTEPYIKWENTSTSDWTYTIYNLERYAANGMPYIYTLSEEHVNGYHLERDATLNLTTGSMSGMVNKFGGSFYVRKNWMDAYNKYNLRPHDVTIKLQWSTDSGTNWEDMPWSEGSDLPTVITVGGQKYVSVKLTNANSINNTKRSSWEYTFNNLPTMIKEGNAWKSCTYRCVETEIGGVPLDDNNTAGAYVCTDTTKNSDKDKKTVIENTLESTSLEVSKIWQNDTVDGIEDYYNSRPESLTFKLQKKSVAIDSSGVETKVPWHDVMVEEDGATQEVPYTFTISKKDGWRATLEDLPVAEIKLDESGNKYVVYSLHFRAVELHADEETTALKPKGAENYIDVTNYADDSADHKFVDDHNESMISNKLILDEPAKSISVKKIWHRVSGNSVTAEFELLYRTKDDTEWHCYGDKELKKQQSTQETPSNELSQKAEDWSEHTEENGCKLKTVTSTDAGEDTISWTDLPKYDQSGKELVYKVVEHPIEGYRTDVEDNMTKGSLYATMYTFTNRELQDYTVEKIWKNAKYAQKTVDGFTAEFKLQQKIGDSGEWTDISGSEFTLTSTSANDDTQKHTWTNLPKYSYKYENNAVSCEKITYRAVETKINGVDVSDNTNGAYIVSYEYEANSNGTNSAEPAFGGTKTTATNRMIYGFVNLSKTAAYLAISNQDNPAIIEGGGKLEGVIFDIYAGTGNTGTPYVKNVKTDKYGNLINVKGKYGDEERYLVSGTYTIVESKSNPDFSIWSKGISFTVGKGEKDDSGNLTDTGEHGTAWISTTSAANSGSILFGLKVEYKEATSSEHSFGDTCTAAKNDKYDTAINLESRGVLTFTKTGKDGDPLVSHSGASGEKQAYFGVYTDEACKNQVAGMKPSIEYGTTMILTNLALDGSVLNKINDNGIPYLREFGIGSLTYSNYPYTLLSGTYYIKELVAPAGYKLDTTIRKAEISKIPSTAFDTDLSGVYPSNKAQIMLVGDTTGVSDYNWSNDPNVVKLYKRDQYGRNVTLKNDGYLVLSICDGTGENTFPTGEKSIYLYQNSTTPATKMDGSPAALSNHVVYTKDRTIDGKSVEVSEWTITGLLEAGKEYTLSEPKGSIPDNNIEAKSITFRMKEDGSIEVAPYTRPTENDTSDTIPKVDPLQVDGQDYKNYYKAATKENVMVMRDVSRYLKDVALEKIDSKTSSKIANISFELYKYDSKNENGTLENVQSVLEDGVYLTTNSEGKIVLYEQSVNIKNKITGCALKYGLDVGKYYFKEVERGASDKYRLVEDIFFEITPTETPGIKADYSDYAKVTFITNSHVDPTSSDEKTATVSNDPVNNTKTLNLSKEDSQNNTQKLQGARFTLKYTSVNNGDPGADASEATECMTDAQGDLYCLNENGAITTKKPDISRKGTYTLIETQAPDGYMTRTENGSPVTMVTFKVDSDNTIKEVQRYTGAGDLVSYTISTDENNEEISLDLTVKNEKTLVSAAKRNDIESGTKTKNQWSFGGELLSGATLEIYEGTEIGDGKKKATLSNGQSEWNWMAPSGKPTGSVLEAGTLKENTIYTLHEVSENTPVGYLTANDLYFKLFGTTTTTVTNTSYVISQLYVWKGDGKPNDLNADGWTKLKVDLKNDSSSVLNVLTMVDEAIIAPVDMQKVVNASGTKSVLPGVKFLVADAGTTVDLTGKVDENLKDSYANALGIAVTDINGYLVWEKIFDTGYNSKHIFTTAGKRAETDADGALNNTIILQQNANGYTFTEIYAPDQAYNQHESFTVKITAQNYRDYKTVAGYDTNKYIDIKAASGSTDKTVTSLSDRTTSAADFADAYENPGFRTTFQLYKYDAEHENINNVHDNYNDIGMTGVKFTLTRLQDDNTYGEEQTITTGTNGLLEFQITKKGTYHLVEKTTNTGYILNNNQVLEFTVINANQGQTLTYDETNTNHTKVVKDANGNVVSDGKVYDLPNYRYHGKVTLTKQDANSQVKLNGVKYTLTRISPTPNSVVDKYFPSNESGKAKSLTVETGKMYTKISSAGSQNDIDSYTLDISTVQETQGQLILEDLQWGTYKLVELQEKDGYILETKELTFKITADNCQKDNVVQENGENFVTNTKNQLTIKKTDLNGIVLNGQSLTDGYFTGAQFKLYPVTQTESGQTMTDNPAKFYLDPSVTGIPTEEMIEISGDSGTTIYGLTKGTYVLREEKAPDGYELTKDVMFTISDTGVISDVRVCSVNTTDNTVTPGNSDTAVSELEDTTITIKDTPIEVSLKKVDRESPDTGLKGAVYEISGTKFADAALNSTTHTGPTGENGTITVTLDATDTNGIVQIPSALMVAGQTYTIHEVTAPDSFELGTDVKIHVETDGTIKISENNSGIADCVILCNDGTVSSSGSVIGLRLKDTPIYIDITKEFADASDMAFEEGAIFSLTPDTDSSFADTENGNLAKNTGIVASGITDFSETPNTVYLKVSAATTGTDKGKGIIRIKKGLLKQGQRYILTEVATSNGYQLNTSTDKMTFTVTSDGKVTFTEKTDGASTFTGNGSEVIHVKNTKINFSVVKKADETTSEYNLDTVKLTLTKVDGQGNAETKTVGEGESSATVNVYQKEWPNTQETTLTDTPKQFVGLTAGYYKLVESHRPAGYLQAADLYFKVNQDNTIQMCKFENGQLVPDPAADSEHLSVITDAANPSTSMLITMKNTLIRGQVEWTKVFEGTNTGIKDAVFTMYKVIGDKDAVPGQGTSGEGGVAGTDPDVVVASGLRTDAAGKWTSVGNTIDKFDPAVCNSGTNIGIENVTAEDTLSKGLTVGRYYLVETGCDSAYLDNNTPRRTYEFEIKDAEGNDNSQSSHYVPANGNVVILDGDSVANGEQPITNIPYKAAFKFWKTEDAAHLYAGIKDAKFEVWYSGTYDEVNGHYVYRKLVNSESDPLFTTNADGKTTVNVDKKGWYLIRESENAGYEVPDICYAFKLTDAEYSADSVPVLLKHTDAGMAGTPDVHAKTDAGIYLEGVAEPVPAAQIKNLVISPATGSFENGDGIENTRKKVNIKLTKVDSISNDKKLKDAEFDLYEAADVDANGKPKADSTPAAHAKTDDNGELLFTGLDWDEVSASTTWGHYILIETKAPDGYHTRTNISVNLTRALFTDPDASDPPVYVINPNDSANEQMKLQIIKQDESGTNLNGATFAIYNAADVTVNDDKTVEIRVDSTTGNAAAPVVPEFTTASGVKDLSGYLIGGSSYALVELTPPDGYKVSPPVFFTVNKEGVISEMTEHPLNEYHSDCGVTNCVVITSATMKTADGSYETENKIQMKNSKIQVSFSKKNLADSLFLKGARFTVTGTFTDGTTSKDVVIDKPAEGSASTLCTVLTGMLIAGEEYTFTETIAPFGYELMTAVVAVDNYGRITVKSASLGTASSKDLINVHKENAEVIFSDTPVDIQIKKVDQMDHSKLLSNAKFVLSPDPTAQANGISNVFAYDPAIDTSITTENGKVVLTTGDNGTVSIPSALLVIGHTYVLEETVAPDGYELAGKVVFTVNDNGSLTVKTIDGQQVNGGSGTLIDLKNDNQSKPVTGLTENGVEQITITNKMIDARIIKTGDVVDSNGNKIQKRLNGVKFTLEPKEGSTFAKTPTSLVSSGNYVELVTTTVDGMDGVIDIEKGILKQKNTYILKEVSTVGSYYLSNSAREGIEIYVNTDGSLVIGGENGSKTKEPYSIKEDANMDSTITVTNALATSFSITKEVSGNMGDLSGTYEITIQVKEPDGTVIKNDAGDDTTVVTLKRTEVYESDGTGVAASKYTVHGGIPVGAIVTMTEPAGEGYWALATVTPPEIAEIEVNNDNKGTAVVKLNPNGIPKKVKILLTNHKDVAIDVGVNTENQSPWASLTLLLPAVWLAYRYKRKRRGGEY